MRQWGLAACLALAPLAAVAQQDDRDYLTAFLEDSLSGAGRHVVVTGFEGLLSARATVQEITIADDQGIWLTLRGVTMDWSRSALLRGEINVSDLSADEILVERVPVAEASSTPAPEAGSFALPELPVSVRVDHLGAGRIWLGPTILGSEVEATLAASLSLAGGEGQAQLVLERTDDGPQGRVALTASYANADQMLAIDLDATEGANGIAATLIGIPGTPATSLTVKGSGPLTDFSAQVALSTDGTDRLAGSVTLTGVAPAGAKAGGLGFAVDLAGDLAPLFLPDYAVFFGDRIALTANGTRWADGRLDLAGLSLNARAINLNGQLALGADGLPQRFDLTGRIADPSGAPVLLPIASDTQTRVESANLKLHFDAKTDDGWGGDITVRGVDRDDFQAAEIGLNGSGRIARVAGAPVVGGTLNFLGLGLMPADANLARALGPSVTGQASFRWRQGDGSLSVQKLELAGADYAASFFGKISGLNDALKIMGTARVSADDLSRFSGVAGQPIGGAGVVTLTGEGSPLTGAFDARVEVQGTNLRMGVAQVDQALRGPSVLTASVGRDIAGTTLRSLHVTAGSITADASGSLASTGVDLKAKVAVGNLASLGAGFGGSVTTTAAVRGTRDRLNLTLDASARNLAVGQPQADRLLAGDSRFTLGLTLRDGAVFVDNANLTNPQMTVTAQGALRNGTQNVTVQARLNNLGIVVPDLPGALTVSGTLVQTAQGTQLNLRGSGPGQIDAQVQGKLAPDFRKGDLSIKGTAAAGLANPFIAPRVLSGRTAFDLRLNGPLALTSLGGQVTLSDARLADPMLPFSVDGITGRVDLAKGLARINGAAAISTGGQITLSGTAGITPPYKGDLKVDIRNALLRDPSLYEVRLGGAVTITGPLLGGALIAGQIQLAQTELQVPSSDFGAAGGLPDLIHRYEPAKVFETRARAGLVEQGPDASRQPSRPYLLDLRINAPSQLFVRGRGLDMELGGSVRLTGSSTAIVPVGSFDLIRGRLLILGRRLDITEARMQLQGAMVPYINVRASADADGTTVIVRIDGPADDPDVRFTSSPELPEEEVLARLLFGSNVENLSVLQAIELANAVRSLAGQGGEGMLSKLRNNLGLDNLDVNTNANGDSTLTAGRYLTKNIYSEVTVDAKGQSEINLNLDLSRSVTLQATAKSDGNSALGIKIEKDY